MSCPYAQASINTNADDNSSDKTGRTVSLASRAVAQAKASCPAFRNSGSNGKISCPFREAHNADEFRQKMLSIPKSHWEGRNRSASGDHNMPSVDPASMRGDASTASTSTDQYAHEHTLEDDPNDISTQFRLVLEHMHLVSKSLNPSETVSKSQNETLSLNAHENGSNPFILTGGCPFKAYYHPKEGDSSQGQKSYDSFGSAMEDFSLAAIMARMAASAEEVTHDNVQLESTKEEHTDKEKVTLSKALKKGTQSSHKAAENVHFVRNFIKGKIKRDLYATLMCNLYFIYDNLEQLLDKHAPVHFPTLHKPHELNRTKTLERDVRYFYGDDWKNKIKLLPATVDYIHRLHNVAKHDPLLLLSHAYTRYLGDLSGGRVLQRVARKALQLQEITVNDGNVEQILTGLDFYDFENIENPKTFKNEYRSALDEMNFLEEIQVSKLVGEANVAFVLNMRVFEELDVLSGDVEGAAVRPLEEALAFFERATLEEEHSSAAKCPFASMNTSKSSQDDAAKCPFASTNTQPSSVSTKVATKEETRQNKGTVTEGEKKRCPWPFVFFHDPMQGMQDYQTWVVIALVCSFVYNRMIEH